MNRANLIRGAILLATSVGAWMMLSLGGNELTALLPGQLAPRDYDARVAAQVVDEVATAANRDEAEAAVPDQLSRDEGAEQAGIAVIEEIIQTAVSGVLDPALPVPALVLPAQTVETTASVSTTAGELAVIEVRGRAFLDADSDETFTEGEGAVGSRFARNFGIDIRRERFSDRHGRNPERWNLEHSGQSGSGVGLSRWIRPRLPGIVDARHRKRPPRSRLRRQRLRFYAGGLPSGGAAPRGASGGPTGRA